MEAIKVDLLDGQEHELWFDVSAARAFKRSYGRSLHDVWVLHDSQLELIDPDCLCHLLAVGLRDDPKPSPDRVEKLLNKFIGAGGKLHDVATQVSKAIGRMFRGDRPDESEGKD